MKEGVLFQLISLIFISGAIVYFIQKARSGATYQIRTIAGLDAMEEAVGRATEMGRMVHFTPGIAGLSGGIDEGPQRRSMNPDSQGLSYLFNRVKKT